MTKQEKAVKLVEEGRCHIGWVSKETNGEERPIAAHGTVDGYTDDAVYQVSYSPAGQICTCPAGRTHRTCSHSLALQLAVAAEEVLQLELTGLI